MGGGQAPSLPTPTRWHERWARPGLTLPLGKFLEGLCRHLSTPPTKTHSLFGKSEESAPIAQRKLRQEDQADLPQDTLSVRLSKSEALTLSRTQSEGKCPHAVGFAESARVPAPKPPGFQPREPFHRGARQLLPPRCRALVELPRDSTRFPACSHRARQPYSEARQPGRPQLSASEPSPPTTAAQRAGRVPARTRT